jgi:hypothetical protein
MERPQLYPRPISPASSRSSFESRHKSPLSISSTVDSESSRTSVDSAYSNTDSTNAFLVSQRPVPLGAFKDGRRSFVEPIIPMRRYGAGGDGRQQGHTTLMTPQRLSSFPRSSEKQDFGVRYTARKPGECFKKLPEEILLVILGELKKSHLEVGSLSCATCWMRDLISLGLSCRKWWSAARFMLYEDIQLNGNDSALQVKKRFKGIKYGIRLKLLRRTLRSRPDLAAYVKSLKVPATPNGATGKKEQEEYMDLIASIIMACPNLERLPGFYPAYNHTFSRFVHALSTRQNLKDAVWVINPSPFQRQHRYTFSKDAQFITPVMAPGHLLPEQCIEFLTYHSNWSHLQTLILQCNPGGTIDSLLFADICNRVPSLENLHISSFPAPAFNDMTLASLPPLKSLRLDNLSGITADGLSTYSCLPNSDTLTSLSLISLPLLSLPALARVFSHLPSLTHFTISQAPSPELPIGTNIYLHPYLACPKLQFLHWEITNPDDDKATDILAKSIFYSGFPSLRTIRAPTDFDGSLQQLCKPRERIELPGDRYRNIGMSGIHTSHSLSKMPSPTRSTFSDSHGRNGSINSSFINSPTRSTFSLNVDRVSSPSSQPDSRERGMSLLSARRMAQQRIDAAHNIPKFHIILWDENGQFVERITVGGFIGQIQSKIFYTLRPDVDGMDEAVVTVDGVGGLLDGGEELNVRDGCTGSWNLQMESAVGKGGKSNGSGKERWWHTERGRWREVRLEKFF